MHHGRAIVTADEFSAQAISWLEGVKYEGYRFLVIYSSGRHYLKAWYYDTDVYTGLLAKQETRKWLLSDQMTKSEVVQTSFKCALTSAEHRCREAFKYNGARVFGPHFDVDDLVALCGAGRDNAGGRR